MNDFKPDMQNLDHLRELWRIAARDHVRLEDAARQLEEGRQIVLAEEILKIMEQGVSKAQAELLARTGERFRHYIRTMHNARRAANDAHVDRENANRLYWDRNNQEAQMRAEMRMSR